jgi:excinuclease ABC subunit A
MSDFIEVWGARQHNLKNISIKIPKNKLVVFTGLSGSGKSSLAFDTIYAEGQRRYVESLSSYARQFLGIMGKPDVDQIDGLSPAISIDQKTTSHNPRSTVGTITEIYDYLRLLFARVGHPHCPKCGNEIAQQSHEEITKLILERVLESASGTAPVRHIIFSPVVRDKKGEFSGLFDNLRKKGYQKVRIDGIIYDLDEDFSLIKTNKHSIDVMIERLTFDKKLAKDEVSVSNLKSRLSNAIEASLKLSDGLAILSEVKDKSLTFPEKPKDFNDHLYSENFACPIDNISLPEIEPRIFSFNSPHGACPTCNGLGTLLKIDPDKIIAPEITLSEGAIVPFASMLSTDSWYSRKIEAVVNHHGGSMKTVWNELSEKLREVILYGDDNLYTVSGLNRQGRMASFEDTFEGVVGNLERRYLETQSDYMRNEIEKYMRKEICSSCNGARLKKTSLSVTIDKMNISTVAAKPIKQGYELIKKLASDQTPLSEREQSIGKMILKEIETRLHFLVSVGLDYLSLAREAGTLAGGEAQRIRLASQIGTGLTGVLYVLDEPSIGLHQRDNERLIGTLKELRDLGNTVIVVEHDRDIMLQSDYIFDFGPGAGKHGGNLVAEGSVKQIMESNQSITGKYLKGTKKIKLTDETKNQELSPLKLTGASLHNLKNLNVSFPLGKLVVVTGVSGSGKSTLIHDTLYRALKNYMNYEKTTGRNYHKLTGAEQINRVSLIDQSPIGKTPRSNPATYTKTFDYIRQVMTNTQEAKIRGYKPGRFSFNVKGGRCEACQGDGQVKIEMQFMADVYVTCDVCNGSRYNSETLEVRYKGKTISDILHLTVEEAVEFFHNHSTLADKLKTLSDVGLSYIELGQPAPTLSGGEAQRVKLAKELSVKTQGHTVYLLDEPTTGLHFEDLKKLLFVLKALVDKGNTVIVIEHNLDVIKNADWLIDLGPEGGDGGGKIVATGTPFALSKAKDSYTGQYMKEIFKSLTYT